MLQLASKELLSQLAAVIEQIREDDYTLPLPTLSGSTFGQHVRHTLEFFGCLMHAEATGVVNYDHRSHDKSVENDKALALKLIGEIAQFLDANHEDFPVAFEADYTIKGSDEVRMPSSFYREVAYNIEHTIHHMALIKIAIILSFNYIELPNNFGVASSTVRYQAQNAS